MLSPAIEPHLPDPIDPAECTALLSLNSGFGGSFGETHFVGHGESVLVLSRADSISDFVVLVLPPDRLPRIRKHRWRTLLDVEGDDGTVHEIELSEDGRRKAMAMLETLYRAREAWPELAALLSARVEDEGGNDRVQSLMTLGEMYLVHLDDPIKAYECYAEVHDNYSHRDKAIGAMEAILERGHMAAKIVPILEEHYRRGHRPEKLSWVLALKGPTLAIAAERAAAYLEAARLTQQLERPADALVLASRALVDTPEDTDVLRVFDELASESGAWDTALIGCENALHDELSRETRWALLSRIATICVDHLQRWPRAESAARALLELDDHDELAWRALDAAYSAEQRWTDLTVVLTRRVVLANHADGVELQYRLGRVFADSLDDPESACAAFYRVLEMNGAHTASFASLDAIHRSRGELSELRELLSRWVTIQTDADQRRAISESLAEVCEQLGDLPAAVDAWSRILVDAPDHGEAIANLVRLRRAMESWQELVDVLLRGARRTEVDRLGRFREAIAVVIEHLDDSPKALELCEEARDACDADRALLDTTRELAKELGRDDELIEVLRELLAIDSLTEADSLAYRVELADALGRTGHTEEALGIWQAIMESHPDDPRALKGLYKLYTATQRWPELADIVARTVKLTESPATKIDILLELAGLYEDKLNDLPRAAQCYDQALAIDPTQEVAAARLLSNLTAQKNWTRLVDVYRSRGMLVEAAEVLEEQLGDLPGALLARKAALYESWTNSTLAEDVARLAIATSTEQELLAELGAAVATQPAGDHAAAFRTLDKVITRLEHGTRNDGLALAIGDHFLHARADHHKAARRYRSVTGELRPEAMRRLRETLRQAADWAGLAAHLERMGSDETLGESERRDVYRELHDVYLNQLDRPDHAAEALRRSKSDSWILVVLVLLIVAGGAAYWLLLGPGA